MAKAGRKVSAALAAFIIVGAPGHAGAEGEPTLVLRVTNYAALSQAVLDVAEARVIAMFKNIGVRAIWAESGERADVDGAVQVAVLLLPREMTLRKARAEGLRDGVLGVAHMQSRRAYILCDRIAELPGLPTLFAARLGDVVAHEVGHLLLQVKKHSSSGIMRANLDQRSMRVQSFDSRQAHTIHATLAAGK